MILHIRHCEPTSRGQSNPGSIRSSGVFVPGSKRNHKSLCCFAYETWARNDESFFSPCDRVRSVTLQDRNRNNATYDPIRFIGFDVERCIDIVNTSCTLKNMKPHQLQLRVSIEEKRFIARAAKRAGLGMSAWVLQCIMPKPQRVFAELMGQLQRADKISARYILASLHDFLVRSSPGELRLAIETWPEGIELSPYLHNYVAAMAETACVNHAMPNPLWGMEVPRLEDPVFASELQSIRLHLLLNAPLAFRRRNIFIDATLGDRV